jgi:hypothetical protein
MKETPPARIAETRDSGLGTRDSGLGARDSRFRALAVLCAVPLLLGVLGSAQQGRNPTPDAALESSAFVCPMHPDYTLDIAGRCPRCGMALVRGTPYDVRDYDLEFSTSPTVVKPGAKATWRFRVFHPGTGAPITRFEPVHERQFHLFVISQDMEHFQHIHPELAADGTWTIDVTLPRAGYYKVLSDFLPSGGASQFIARAVVTAGYAGDLEESRALLRPDVTATKVVDDITATVSYDPAPFIAGLYGHLTFHLTDTATGRPITDLQTYLGAFGHTLIMSEDMIDYVHAHPLDIVPGSDEDNPEFVIPPGADLEALRGGPEVTFDGLMPRPGRYRAWTQFRRNDTLHTFVSTFEVVSP